MQPGNESNITVQEITGTVVAVSPDGTVRELSAGSELLPGDTLQTSEGSTAILVLPNGDLFTVPAASALTLPPAGTPFVPDVSLLNSLLSSAGAGAIQQDSKKKTEKALEEMNDGEEGTKDRIDEEFVSDDRASNFTDTNSEKEHQFESEKPDDSGLLILDKQQGIQLVEQKQSNDSEENKEAEDTFGREKLLDLNDYNLNQDEHSLFSKPEQRQSSLHDSTFEKTSEQLVNSPINLHQKDFINSSQSASVFGTQIQPVMVLKPETVVGIEPVTVSGIEPIAVSDTGSILTGQMLDQQNGMLGNDYGSNIRLISMNGESVSSTGATTIEGDLGSLTIRPDGSYTYSAADIDTHSDLVAYWGFNQSTSDTIVRDQSLVDRHADQGTLQGQAAIVSGGVSGNALSLDGTGDHVSFGDIHSATVDDYIDPWENTEVLNNDFSVLYSAQGWQIEGLGAYINPNNFWYLSVSLAQEAVRNVDTSDSLVEMYELTFALGCILRPDYTGEIEVLWGGEVAATYTIEPGTGTINTTKTLTLPATGDPTTELRFRTDGISFNLDDIVINKVIPGDPFNIEVEASHGYSDNIESHGGDIEARTISFSFKPGVDNDLSGRQVLYTEGGGNGGFIIYIQNNTLYAGAHNGADWSGEYLSTDISGLDSSQWHNVALTLDGTAGTLEAFLDGNSFGVSNSAQALNDVVGGVGLGSAGPVNKYHDGVQQGAFTFDGQIDEVRVYERVLTGQEINALIGGAESQTDHFTYTIQDENGDVSTSTLDITVNAPGNIAPILADDTLTVTEGQLIAANSVASQGLLANDSDADGDALTLVEVAGVAIPTSGITNIIGQHGTLIIAPDGTYAYTPLSSVTSGTEVFSYTVTDGTTTSIAHLAVSIIPDLFANADSVTINESSLSAEAIYVLEESGSTEYLSVVNTETGVTHRLGPITGATNLQAIAQSPTGTLYGADNTNIYSVDPATQTTTVIGAHGLTGSTNITGLTVAPDGTIYANTEVGEIYTVNGSTGGVTSLGNVSSAGFTHIYGDIVWHDGALYVQAYDSNSPDTFHFVRINPEMGNTTFKALPNAYDSTHLNALASVEGELVGIAWSRDTPMLATIDTDTGLVGEWNSSTGISWVENATAIEQGVQGNVLANDTDGQTVTTVELQDGTSQAVTNEGVTLQGLYGTLTIRGDGTYIYNIDNSLDSTNSLNAGETGNERFIYTAMDSGGAISQSILTVYVNGANDIQVADEALITDYTMVDSVDTSSNAIPIDFVATTQNPTDKITEIRITKPQGTTFNIPSEWFDVGTVTGDDITSTELVWTAIPGANAGLDSIDALADGLSLSSWSGLFMNISVTVSEYDIGGTLTDSWSSTSAISISLVGIDNTYTGGAGSNTLTGESNENNELIGGAGNDTLTGGDLQDFFVWEAGHEGTESAPATDTITNFNATTFGDVLDLRELLPENASTHLDEFLSFSFNGGDTTIGVSTTEGGPVVQKIVLDGVDLSANYGTTDVTQITNQLTDNGNLLS